jgi:hypothetical protein
MDNKEKIQSLNIVMNGITINGPMFDIHDNKEVHNHFITSPAQTMNASEAKVKDTLLTLLDATDEEGNRIFTEKGQWYAVYKVLSECYGYPSKISEFCEIMTNWGMDKVTPACSYESVKKIPTNITATSNKVILWHNLKDKAEPKFMKQIIVAMKLMELLEK